MKSGDVNRAESLFNTSTKKTSSMYGSMMKGENIILSTNFNVLYVHFYRLYIK